MKTSLLPGRSLAVSLPDTWLLRLSELEEVPVQKKKRLVGGQKRVGEGDTVAVLPFLL